MKTTHIKNSSTENASLNIGRYINLLLNNIKFICIVVIITSITAFVVSYLLPKKFQASSTISVEENIVSDLVQGIAITTSVESKIRLLEVQLLSRNLLSEVASLLELDLLANTEAKKETLISNLRNSTSIWHDKKRGVFYISFTNDKPTVARDFVNTLIRVYIEQNTSEKRQESFDATTFLSDQIEIFQERIDKAQDAIDAYKVEQGMYLSLNEGLVQQKINNLDQQIETIRIEKNKLNSEKLLTSDIAKISDELREQETKLRDAQSIYTEKHPAIQRLTVEVANTKRRLEEAKNNTESESNNTQFQIIQIELNSLEETELSLIKERDENLKNLEALPAIKTRLTELEQTKSNEMIIYDQLVSRFGQSEVSKQMELQDKAVSFKVIDAAITPTKFIFPMRYLIMIAGIIAGFGLAIGIIILKSILRPQIHSADDLHVYSAPVLVKLPIIIQPEVLAKRKLSNLIFILITLGVIGVIFMAAVLEFLGYTYIERLLPF